ncbi:MAG: DinB family protein [Chloroflexi bacterium]|nr:DinB family protein [Chloroflexota bacterium]
MTAHIDTQRWKTDFFDIFNETFEKVNGIYLDKGTSLFETLATVSAEEASRPIARECASIAAQVNHVRYYLEVLCAYTRGQPPASLDWPGSWQQVTTVSPAEWDAQRQQLYDTYQQTRALFENLEDWNAEDQVGGALAIVVHTAYHLGEIRQGLGVLRG